MDSKTLDKVADFLKNATPTQLTQIAQDMADKAPHLILLQLSDKEKAVGLIKMHLSQLAESPTEMAIEYYTGYVQGLIASAYEVGVLSDDENEFFHSESDRVAHERRIAITADNQGG